MPNSLQSSAIASPASRRATNCIRSSVTEHSFQGISPSLKPGGSVTHVSGTMCYLCLRPLICVCYRPALYILLSEEWRSRNLPSCSNLRPLWLISAVQGTNQQLTRQEISYDHLNGCCVVDS